MAQLISLSIDTKKLSKSDFKNGQYLNVTIAINDNENEYGQNVSAWITQEKEARENEEPRSYVGNGKTIWADGKVFTPEKTGKKSTGKKPAAKKKQDEDELPW